jgi:hypothetical protein
MAGHKPANSGSGKKLWRQYNEEQLQKVGATRSTKQAASSNPVCAVCPSNPMRGCLIRPHSACCNRGLPTARGTSHWLAAGGQ